MKQHKLNQQISANQIRLIGPNGENFGLVSLNEALNKAATLSLDLVEMSSNNGTSICKIIDYNKYLYDQKSRFKNSKTKKVDNKEFLLSPNIGEGDMNHRIKRAREFLSEGSIVKFRVVFERREYMFPDLGIKKLKIVESELSDIAKVDKFSETPNMMFMTFIPKSS